MSNTADRSITSATSRGTLRRNRVWTFVALCAAAAIVAAAYTARAVRRGPAAPTSEIELQLLATVPSPPYLIVSSTAPGNMWRRRSEEHTSELQSLAYLVCRLLLEK